MNTNRCAKSHCHDCPEPLAPWERVLLGLPERRDGVGTVIFTRTDGRTVKFDNVLIDSVSPVGANMGTIAVEFDDSDRIVHVPFVESWVVTY